MQMNSLSLTQGLSSVTQAQRSRILSWNVFCPPWFYKQAIHRGNGILSVSGFACHQPFSLITGPMGPKHIVHAHHLEEISNRVDHIYELS